MKVSKKDIDVFFKINNCAAGAISFSITAGNQKFESVFYEYTDPLPALKKWLISVSNKAQHSSICFDPESEEINFDVAVDPENGSVFTVSEYYNRSRIYLQARVDEGRLVESFLSGFDNFIKSGSYDPIEWEKIIMVDQLERVFNINREEIVYYLESLSRSVLEAIMNFIYQNRYNLYATGMGKGYKPGEYNLLGPGISFEKALEDFKKVFSLYIIPATKVINDSILPEIYDTLPAPRKRETINELLNMNIGDYHGKSLIKMHA